MILTVFFEAAEPDKTIIRWQDHGIPQAREYARHTVRQDRAVPRDTSGLDRDPRRRAHGSGGGVEDLHG